MLTPETDAVILGTDEAYILKGDKIIFSINLDFGSFIITPGDNTDNATYDDVMAQMHEDDALTAHGL